MCRARSAISRRALHNHGLSETCLLGTPIDPVGGGFIMIQANDDPHNQRCPRSRQARRASSVRHRPHQVRSCSRRRDASGLKHREARASGEEDFAALPLAESAGRNRCSPPRPSTRQLARRLLGHHSPTSADDAHGSPPPGGAVDSGQPFRPRREQENATGTASPPRRTAR